MGLRRIGLLVLAIGLLASACGGGSGGSLTEDDLVLVVSSDLAVGPHRVAVAALNEANESLAQPDLDVSFEFFRPDGTPAGAAPADFIWAIPDIRGMWVTEFEFDVAGGWLVGVRDSGGTLVVSPPFSVLEQTVAVDVGSAAPASVTKTSGDGPLAEITSDLDPEPTFYATTVADAVTSGNPSVIVFATPAFCVSATCAPALDVAKDAAAAHPDVEFVHVEVFDNLDATTREELMLVPAVIEWGLQTEPWVYVVDSSGVVTARFEGAIGADELDEALADIG
jgi:hypothetical protein